MIDATVQTRINDATSMPEQFRPSGDWDLVQGEIITFTDPLRSLLAIDRLEGFHPGRPSLYQRVLLPVYSYREAQVCWTYIMTGCSMHRRLRDGIWQPFR